MILGFTGTSQNWMITEAAWQQLEEFVYKNREYVKRLDHGDCVGADARMHELALSLGIAVRIHPPEIETKRAFCKGALIMEQPWPYLVRNHNIVKDCDILL